MINYRIICRLTGAESNTPKFTLEGELPTRKEVLTIHDALLNCKGLEVLSFGLDGEDEDGEGYTIEDALTRLEDHTQYYIPVDDSWAFDMAVDALREKQEAECHHA